MEPSIAALRVYTAFAMVVGGLIGWQLHGVFQ